MSHYGYLSSVSGVAREKKNIKKVKITTVQSVGKHLVRPTWSI